jgi:uncharacterized protein (TIGR02145 family)
MSNTYADFRQSYVKVQTYTFTGPAITEFTYRESIPGMVEKFEPNVATKSVRVTFNEKINEWAAGVTSKNPLTVEIYALNSTAKIRYKLVIRIQDCLFCGARTITGGWFTFMCQNLGANESMGIDEQIAYRPGSSLDETVYGYLYQWGRPSDGHQKRNSTVIPTQMGSIYYPYPYFFTSTKNEHDWLTGGNVGDLNKRRWGDGSQALNPQKNLLYDPCPTGWKIPSQLQWQYIFRNSDSPAAPSKATASAWIWTSGNTKGYRVGEALFLPAAGFRDYDKSGTLKYVGSWGRYWSSTWSNSCLGNGYVLEFKSGSIDPANHGYVARGGSVRCIAEE